MKSDLRLVPTTDQAGSFAALARRLRDNRQPITPEIRETLAQIVDAFAAIHENNFAIGKYLASLKQTGE